MKVLDLDKKITLKALASLPEVDVHDMTTFRWRSRGIKRGSSVVKLRTERTTKGHLTTLRWYREFHAALQDDQRSRDEILKPNLASVERQLAEELAK